MPQPQPQPKEQTEPNLLTRSFDLHITKRVDDQAGENRNLILQFPFSSEEPYVRADWWTDERWTEVLGHRAEEADLTRLNAGAAVLLNHGHGGTNGAALRSVGKTVRAWIENGRGYVEVKMSRRAGMEPLLQDIEDGLIPGVSVGYRILEKKLTQKNEAGPDEYRVTRWQPMEVTLCDVPADATVGIGRSITTNEEIKNMKLKDNAERVADDSEADTATAPTPTPEKKHEPSSINPEALRSEILATERKRMSEIRKLVRSVKLDDALSDDMIERGINVDDARKEVLEQLANRSESQPITSRADIHTIRDETETRREMMTEALLHRSDPSRPLPDGARQFVGLSLIELARDSLADKGVSTRGLDRMQVATRAFQSTSDFPDILANVANKSLRQAYESAPRTFTPWARQTSAADFKPINRAALSDAPALETVTENGEFKRGAITDGKETYQLVTVGKILGLTRQAIINDDLSAFTRLPAMFASAAANYESDTVYSILTANANLADGVALFHNTHANLTGTGTVISVDSLGVARSMMRKQKTPKGNVMNLLPRFMIVPSALETVAAQFVSQAYVASQSSHINPFAGALEVISEARLDASSATAWYLAADNGTIDTVEYCYLEGNNGVYLETRQGFDVDGMEIKARLDFAAKAIDYRGLYKNNGTAG